MQGVSVKRFRISKRGWVHLDDLKSYSNAGRKCFSDTLDGVPSFREGKEIVISFHFTQGRQDSKMADWLGLQCPTTTIVDHKFLLTTQVKRKRYYGVSTVLRSIVRLSYVTNMAELCEDEK